MLKHSVHLEVKTGDRTYKFDMPIDSPLGEVFDALYKMRTYVVERMNESQKIDKAKEPEQANIE